MCEVDRAHQAERNGDGHGDDRADEDRAPEERNRAEGILLAREHCRLRAPLRTEQELYGRNHAEESDGFEEQRCDDADRGQDRDERGEKQCTHHQSLNARTGAEVWFHPGKGIGAAGEGQDQRNGGADRAVKRQCLAISGREFGR